MLLSVMLSWSYIFLYFEVLCKLRISRCCTGVSWLQQTWFLLFATSSTTAIFVVDIRRLGTLILANRKDSKLENLSFSYVYIAFFTRLFSLVCARS